MSERLPTRIPDFIFFLVGLTVLLSGCAEDVTFRETGLIGLNGQHIDPFQDTCSRAIVFVFTRSDCPISNRYAPELTRLQEIFSPRGVKFYLVYPDPDEGVETIRAHIEKYGYRCGVLRDPQHYLVRRTGAAVTPEAVVFNPDGKMVYRGRIDDRFVDFGKTRPSPTKHDLQEVLTDVVAGRSAVSFTKAVGCFISDLK